MSAHPGGIVTAPASQPRALRRLAITSVVAVPITVLVTTLVAAALRAAGVDLVVETGETIPVSGIGVVTGLFSVVGVVIAGGLLRWSSRPAERFVWTTGTLTVLSLVPPLLWARGPAAALALIGLHLVAAAVMIPALARSLRTHDR